MIEMTAEDGHLTGMLLIAMPNLTGAPFARSVVFLCAHSSEGAMGLVVNQVASNVSFANVVEQLGIEGTIQGLDTPIHFGGPVEASRGFVLHTADYVQESTLLIDDTFALTATVEVLKAIARGEGPRRCVLALGYAGWGAGQLDKEIQANGWLMAPPDSEIVFDRDNETKWIRALGSIGVNPSLLSTAAGHA
jgi:putative transcriptional regulator